MAGNITPYLSIITSEHSDKPKYTSMVGQTAQPFADLTALYDSIPLLYDVDVAVGAQLDTVGLWVGVTRQLTAPLAGVYFAFDTADVGFDQGVWMGPYDPATGLVSLPDDYYRMLIKIRILNNHWDGSKDQATTLVNAIFNVLGYQFFIKDHADLTMDMGLIGPGSPSAIVKALLTGGKFDVKPDVVHISNYIYQTVSGPMFAFDLNNSLFAGFDTGAWAQYIAN